MQAPKKCSQKIPANSILTPHPGELERLIGKFKSAEETLEKQIKFSKKHSVFVVQKGAFSKITCPDGTVIINSSGNPGMASAGMGDVLTGMIGSLLAQGYTPKEAVTLGVFLHGYAADLVQRKQGERGMIASDVIDQIPLALNAF
ncbi:MAG: NAD(P)H-hydrate dehydratase [Crocinitomicaceae bacterium]|nr:NAD(P)H-hydrate dehydratase [Crocinitomicaceae bacterium]